MKKQLAVSALAGVITFVVVFEISHIAPRIMGVLLGAVNAAVIFGVGHILKGPRPSN